jgi:4-hydroxybenzoate polyprenyltransferase
MPATTVLTATRPPVGRRLLGLVRLVHPFPSLLNAAVVAALACVAVRGWPGGGRLLWLSVTMLCIQCAIGALNDWADRELDARSKPAKPIPAGLVPPGPALAVAVGFGATAAVLAAAGGAAAWLLAMAGLGVGVAYDLGVKRTPFSALTYAVALPLIPLWVWTALDRSSPALYAILPLGMLLGASLQLVNALPDAEGDAAVGVRGTLQVLGPARGRRLAWSLFGLALVLSLALAPVVRLRLMPFAICWLVAALLLMGAVLAYQRRRSARSLQLGWSLLAPAAGIFAVGWLVSVP